MNNNSGNQSRITPIHRDQSFERPAHTTDPIAPLCHELLTMIGEDPSREGLARTPERFAKAFRELTGGYQQSSQKIVNDALFEHSDNNTVLVRDIDFYSLCEHHLLPFYGKATIAYIPNGKIIGLSKIPRIVDMFARRLQVQERLTSEICAELSSLLNPLGVACSMEGQHMCMMMRGVQAHSSRTTTTCFSGQFESNPAKRQEFFELLKVR